jgi:hypothetical protein
VGITKQEFAKPEYGFEQLPLIVPKIQQGLVLLSSDGSFVATPGCKPAFPGSNSTISTAYSGLPVLRWAAIWNGNFTLGCPLRGGRREYKQKGFWSIKTIKKKKDFFVYPK